MSDRIEKKPNVFPTQEQINSANNTSQDNNVVGDVGAIERSAAEEMARRTQEQIAKRDALLKEQEERARVTNEKRDEMMNQKPPSQPPVVPPVQNNYNELPKNNPEPNKYSAISQPQYNAPYDVISLPSAGKLYRNGKKTVKVGLLTASDENILSNPNLMENGEFLEILINRKLLEEDLRYNDLHVGDRNAILVWLRATSFGYEYPIEVYDPKTYEPFEHVVDLSKIKTKSLEIESDNEGFFDYQMPISKDNIKFKFLTVNDVDDIEEHEDYIKTNVGAQFIDTITYTLQKQIVEVNGDRNPAFIKNYIDNLRVGDSRAFRKYVDEVESGIDMRLEVETPSGETIFPSLPFNVSFFWPQF